MLENTYDITMQQGSDYELTMAVKDSFGNTKNLTSYSARMQIRPSYSSTVISSELSTANGEILIYGANGTIKLALTADRTAAIRVDLTGKGKPPSSTYVYDLELIDGDGKVSKLLYGNAIIYGEVTR